MSTPPDMPPALAALTVAAGVMPFTDTTRVGVQGYAVALTFTGHMHVDGVRLDEPAGVDASRDALFKLVRGLEAEDVLEERSGARALVSGPREERVELVARAGQSEEFEVSSEPRDDGVVVASSAVSLRGLGRVASLGHAGVSWVRDRDAEVRGRRSYSVRSRGTVRA